jgi:tight adherence protein B
MMPVLITVFAFVAAFLGVLGVNALLVDLTSRERKRMRQRLDEQHRARQRDKVRLESVNFSKIAADVRNESESESIIEKAKFVLEQSGLDITWSRLVALMVASGVVLAAIIFLALNVLPLALAFGMVGALLPFMYVFAKRHERLKRLREQLPDALDLMSRVMRSGQSISQAMQAVSHEFSQPISLEFLYCHEQMNMGLSAEVALRQLAMRAGLLEVKIFVLAVVVQRQTGGNLAELLDKLGEVIRERFRIDGMIKSLTAQGRFQALILLSLPPAMFVLLMVINPEYEMQLFDYPGFIALAMGMMTIGAVMVNRIVNFDY